MSAETKVLIESCLQMFWHWLNLIRRSAFDTTSAVLGTVLILRVS